VEYLGKGRAGQFMQKDSLSQYIYIGYIYIYYISLSLSFFLYLSLSLSIYIYIYIHIFLYTPPVDKVDPGTLPKTLPEHSEVTMFHPRHVLKILGPAL